MSKTVVIENTDYSVTYNPLSEKYAIILSSMEHTYSMIDIATKKVNDAKTPDEVKQWTALATDSTKEVMQTTLDIFKDVVVSAKHKGNPIEQDDIPIQDKLLIILGIFNINIPDELTEKK